MIAFTIPWGIKFNKSIILLDGVTGEAKKFEDDRFNFKGTMTVVVLNELYAFKNGNPVSAYKIADFTSTDHLVIPLSTLPLNENLQLFAVSYWAAAGSIVMTGGLCDIKTNAKTFLLDVQTVQWEKRSFPDLNVARHSHVSMTLDKQCYVACGNDGSELLRSIEMLRLGAQAWELIAIPELTPRRYPILS